MKNFSDRLADRMEKLGITQSSLANRLKTSQSTVNRWLNGSVPRNSALSQLSGILGVSKGWLITGDGPEPPVVMTEENQVFYQELLEELIDTCSTEKLIEISEEIANPALLRFIIARRASKPRDTTEKIRTARLLAELESERD